MINKKTHSCVDCKTEKADLIRGAKDYLCVACFKKWHLTITKNEKGGENGKR